MRRTDFIKVFKDMGLIEPVQIINHKLSDGHSLVTFVDGNNKVQRRTMQATQLLGTDFDEVRTN